jgi:hypothetical protein
MASIIVNAGSGSTQTPRNLNIPAVKTVGQNPSANWWVKYTASYNQPTTSINTADYYARQAASRTTAEALAEAQRRAAEQQTKRLLAEREDQARAALQRGNAATAARLTAQIPEEMPTLFGAPLAGPLGKAATSFFRDPMGKIGEFLTSEAPNFNITTDPMGNPLPGQDQMDEMQPTSRSRGPERPGYMQQPVMDRNGSIIGYEYVKLVQPKVVTAEEQTAATQNNIGSGPNVTAMGAASIYDEITALENSYAKRRYDAAVRMWGEPVKDPRTGQLDWSQGGREYLGMAPGEIASPTLQEPAADAPYKDWAKYRDRLKAQQTALTRQSYTESSVKEAFYSMGTKGIKELQRTFLAAGLYDENDVVALGNIGEKELSFMTDLMMNANINGTTWEEQFEIFQQAAAEQKRTGSGGGGGGGGGGTSVYTQIQYTQTSMAQGRSLLASVLQDALGRKPTDSELAQFIDMLNKAESKSPTKTVTRTTKDGKSSRSVGRTTPSDVDPQMMAEEFAESIGGGAPAAANKRDNYLIGFLNSLGGSIG